MVGLRAMANCIEASIHQTLVGRHVLAQHIGLRDDAYIGLALECAIVAGVAVLYNYAKVAADPGHAPKVLADLGTSTVEGGDAGPFLLHGEASDVAAILTNAVDDDAGSSGTG